MPTGYSHMVLKMESSEGAVSVRQVCTIHIDEYCSAGCVASLSYMISAPKLIPHDS